MTQNFYLKPQEISIGFDNVKNKGDSIQYVPIFETLNVILEHEDVLGEVTSNFESEHANLATFKSFKDGRYFKENVLFQSNRNALQICLYHDYFNIVNPLGNKTDKCKVSAFYFVVGNFLAKFKSRLKVIHLAVLSPASFVSKYGCKTILAPLLDDIKKIRNRRYSSDV